MSSLPHPNYWASQSSSQSNQRGYAGTSHGASQTNHYHNQMKTNEDIRQSQYGSNTYGWSLQPQGTAAPSSEDTYTNGSWAERPVASTTYGYQRDVYPPSDQSNMANQSYQSRGHYNSQNTQGLDHLAYASGLEPPIQSTSNNRAASDQQRSGYNTTVTAPASQARTASPAHGAGRYHTNAAQSSLLIPYTPQPENTTSSTDNNSLAVDATKALAGAVRQRQQHSHQVSNQITSRLSNSPTAANTQPTTTSQGLRTGSSGNANLPSEHQVNASSQSRPVSSATNKNPRTALRTNHKKAQPSGQQRKTQPSQTANQTRSVVTQDSSQQPLIDIHPQSIANLVTRSDEGDDNSSSAQPDQSVESQDTMPNYIDPTQVFNPYHREHERKKREAAEAEVRRKAEEQRLVEEQRKLSEDAARRSSESAAATKNAQQAQQTIANSTANPSPSGGSEDAMALELQKMMGRMKELRTTNPTLFQKLWNDIRGGTSTTTQAATASTQSPSPQITRVHLVTDTAKPSPPAKARSKQSEGNTTSVKPPANGYRVTVENNEEGLPDLGRFPAERRIRQPITKQNKNNDASEAQQLPTDPPVASTVQFKAPIAIPRPTDPPPPPWPEPRRRAVANAAIQWLKAKPENASITITAQEITSVLEQNPSYLDLCTHLESCGFKFQRTSLARDLLKSVPELQPQSKTPTSQQQGGTAISLTPPTPSSSVQKSSAPSTSTPQAVPQAPSSMETTTHLLSPVSTGPMTPKVEHARSGPKPQAKASRSRASAPSRPEPPMGTKEAAARKRDFAELIDLSGLGDDENYVLPPKQPRLEPPSRPDPFKHIQTDRSAGFSSSSSVPLKFDPQSTLQAQLAPNPVKSIPTPEISNSQSRLDLFQQHKARQPGGKSRMILAKKIDPSEALQKRYYDPKTVARDILIASGRHPSQRPLNLHLAVLLDNFIDIDSDLSTFDWDSVDPGGPPIPKVDYVDVPAGPPRFAPGDRVGKRAKLSLIDKTRDPNAKRHSGRPTPNSHPTSPAPSLLRASVLAQKSHKDSDHSSSDARHRLNDVNRADKARKSTPDSRKISIDIPVTSSQKKPHLGSHQTTTSKPNMESDSTPSIKRRGRPPGSKNKNTTVAAMKQQAKATIAEAAKDETPDPLLHSYKCRWVKCHAELHNVDTLKRHILKVHDLKEEESTKQGGYICWWKRCRYLEPDSDGTIAASRVFKDREEWSKHIEEEHVQPIALKYGDGPKTSHTGKPKPMELDLSRFFYHPQDEAVTRTLSHTDPQSVRMARERYLADANGRATTPLVSSDGNVDHPPDAMTLTRAYPQGPKTDKEKADVAGHNAYMRAHGSKTRDTRQAAEEVVRAMEARKQKIGPGLDRGGCTLINETRRNTFLQAPGISTIVDAEW